MERTATKRQVFELAEELDVEMEYDDSASYWDLQGWAPEDKIFTSSSACIFAVSWFKTPGQKEFFWGVAMDELESLEDY